MGLELITCCKLEPMGTQGYGKILKIIQVLEDGRFQQRRQETGGLKDREKSLRAQRGPENADAAAKLAFHPGTKGRDGRQAKAACRFRRDCLGYTEIPENQRGPESGRHGIARKAVNVRRRRYLHQRSYPAGKKRERPNSF